MAEKIGSFLENLIPREHKWKIKLCSSWKDIIGDLEDKVRIEKISRDYVVLGVSHPAWAQELFFLAGVIKNKINMILNEEKIKEVRIKSSYYSVSQKNIKSFFQQDESDYKFCLTKNQEESLMKINDEDLRNSLKNYLIRSKKLKRKVHAKV